MAFRLTQPLLKTLLILGKPGGGKGTISKKIIKSFPTVTHLSTGDILRKQILDGTPTGLSAKTFMDAGQLVPDALVIKIVADALSSGSGAVGGHTLLDGFPRTLSQAEALEAQGVKVDCVLSLNVPTQVIIDRISDRWLAPSTGTIYSYSYAPPKVHGKDDVTGEALIQREDDKPESVKIRLEAFDVMNGPLVSFYGDKEVVEEFKGSESDVIYKMVQPFLEKVLKA